MPSGLWRKQKLRHFFSLQSSRSKSEPVPNSGYLDKASNVSLNSFPAKAKQQFCDVNIQSYVPRGFPETGGKIIQNWWCLSWNPVALGCLGCPSLSRGTHVMDLPGAPWTAAGLLGGWKGVHEHKLQVLSKIQDAANWWDFAGTSGTLMCVENQFSLSLHHLRISLPLYTIPRSDLASSTSQHENRSSSLVDVEMASQNVFTRLAITWHVMLITMTSCWATLSKGPGWIITISSSHTYIYIYVCVCVWCKYIYIQLYIIILLKKNIYHFSVAKLLS